MGGREGWEGGRKEGKREGKKDGKKEGRKIQGKESRKAVRQSGSPCIGSFNPNKTLGDQCY